MNIPNQDLRPVYKGVYRKIPASLYTPVTEPVITSRPAIDELHGIVVLNSRARIVIYDYENEVVLKELVHQDNDRAETWEYYYTTTDIKYPWVFACGTNSSVSSYLSAWLYNIETGDEYEQFLLPSRGYSIYPVTGSIYKPPKVIMSEKNQTIGSYPTIWDMSTGVRTNLYKVSSHMHDLYIPKHDLLCTGYMYSKTAVWYLLTNLESRDPNTRYAFIRTTDDPYIETHGFVTEENPPTYDPLTDCLYAVGITTGTEYKYRNHRWKVSRFLDKHSGDPNGYSDLLPDHEAVATSWLHQWLTNNHRHAVWLGDYIISVIPGGASSPSQRRIMISDKSYEHMTYVYSMDGKHYPEQDLYIDSTSGLCTYQDFSSLDYDLYSTRINPKHFIATFRMTDNNPDLDHSAYILEFDFTPPSTATPILNARPRELQMTPLATRQGWLYG